MSTATAPAPQVDFVKLFTSSTDNLNFMKYNGQDVYIVGTPEFRTPDETGSMFIVRASDGFEFTALVEELS